MTRVCVDCGKDISDLPNRSIRCAPCQHQYTRQHRKHYQAQRYDKRHPRGKERRNRRRQTIGHQKRLNRLGSGGFNSLRYAIHFLVDDDGRIYDEESLIRKYAQLNEDEETVGRIITEDGMVVGEWKGGLPLTIETVFSLTSNYRHWHYWRDLLRE